MKKVIAFILCFSCLLPAFCIDYNEIQTNIERNALQNSAFLIDGFKTSKSILEGKYGLCFESQTAFSRKISAKAIEEHYYNVHGFSSSICLGPQINLFNNALEGILVGMYPGFVLNFTDSIGTWRLKWICDVSYNVIAYKNVMIGCSIRKDLLRNEELEVMVKIGFAMESKKYKVY